MDDVMVIEENDVYLLFVSDPIEGISKERHYAVYNKTTEVVEFRTTMLPHAKRYIAEATLVEQIEKDEENKDDDRRIWVMNNDIQTH